MDDQPILILGATGDFGGAVLAAALDRGLCVRALARNAHEARGRLGAPVGLEWVSGDARDPAAVQRAVLGARAIVHAIDVPPADRATLLPAIAGNVAAAARAAGVPILFPGSVHVLGPGDGRPVPEDAAPAPTSRRGRIEAEVAGLLAEGCDLLTLRAGDRFGPDIRHWPGAGLFASLRAGRVAALPGNAGRPHQWCFLPDLARVALDLIDLGWQGQTVVHGPALTVQGNGDFARAISRAAGHAGQPLRRQPWWILRLRALTDPGARDLLDQRYLWDDGILLAPGRLGDLLPEFKPTPLDRAIALTLAG